MILPDKYTSLTESFIGISALILDIIGDRHVTIEKLWAQFNRKYIKGHKLNTKPSYEKFIYTVEFMFLCGMIVYNEYGEILNENLKSEN